MILRLGAGVLGACLVYLGAKIGIYAVFDVHDFGPFSSPETTPILLPCLLATILTGSGCWLLQYMFRTCSGPGSNREHTTKVTGWKRRVRDILR